MKLIDLLVKELPNRGGWPVKVTSIGQDYDRELMFYGIGKPRTGIILDDLAVDRRKCGYQDEGVTREQYEAALAASECWIEWGGGECPVHESANVDIKLENGSEKSDAPASAFIWQHDDDVTNIIAYRLHKPQQEEQPDASEEDLNDCIGQAPATLWNGRWLPYEYQYKVHGSEWCRFECIAVDGKAVFGWSNNTPVALQSNTHNFRPLRTESEKAREAAIQDLTSVISGIVPDTGMATATMYAERVYDAGYRKEVK